MASPETTDNGFKDEKTLFVFLSLIIFSFILIVSSVVIGLSKVSDADSASKYISLCLFGASLFSIGLALLVKHIGELYRQSSS